MESVHFRFLKRNHSEKATACFVREQTETSLSSPPPSFSCLEGPQFGCVVEPGLDPLCLHFLRLRLQACTRMFTEAKTCTSVCIPLSLTSELKTKYIKQKTTEYYLMIKTKRNRDKVLLIPGTNTCRPRTAM